MSNTQPLSACCKAPPNKWYLSITGIYACSKCNSRYGIAPPSGTIKAQQVSGTSMNVSSTKTIPAQNIATPDTEDEIEKEIEFIVNPQPELSEMLEGNFTKLFKQLQKDLIRKLIRTEKLKDILTSIVAVSEFNKKPLRSIDWSLYFENMTDKHLDEWALVGLSNTDLLTSDYTDRYDIKRKYDLNAIREKLQKSL